MIKSLLFIVSSSFLLATQLMAQSFDVMTYNIKYDDKKDSINGWSARKDHVIGLIKYHDPELFGTQEGLQYQLDDIKAGLEGYEYIGIGRDGDVGLGEYSAIFYDTNVFELKNSGTFWLSESPDKAGESWDAAFPRICTWGKFTHKATGQIILYFNTHFDHVGVTARSESAKLILQEINKLKEENDAAKIILTGDFNFTPDAAPYELISKDFADTYSKSKTQPYGPEATFNGFHFNKMPERRIDYVFIQEGFEVLRYATLSDSRNMKYPSDHFPVLVELKIKE